MHHIDLATLTLEHGKHQTRDDGVCLMEAVAYFADEPHSDRPQCASLVLSGFGISLNDTWDNDWRQKLKPFIPRLVGTRDDQDEARGLLALDWLIRTYTPAWLDLGGHPERAQELRDLRRIVDQATAELAGPVVRKAEREASAARSAARSAAWSAAESAAESAARSAAWSAARSAAWSAAESAARSAAWSAARSAAWSAAESAARSAAWSAADQVLSPTVDVLKVSALDLFDRMIDPGNVR